jgi:hypothetical protein
MRQNRDLTVNITLAETVTDGGRLADAELVFTAGPLKGAKIVGFAVWPNKHTGGENVTFPARHYTNAAGRRRSYSFIQGEANGMRALRMLILDAYRATATADDGPSDDAF